MPCQNFTIEVWHDGADPSFASKVKLERESHDALKYRNWDPYFQEFDSVRRTRFRYVAYAGGGQAWEDQINFEGSPVTFVHELGHTIGLAHWGRREWGMHPSLLVSRYESAVCFPPCLIERRNGSTSFANSAS